jgi:hypothetical protein
LQDAGSDDDPLDTDRDQGDDQQPWAVRAERPPCGRPSDSEEYWGEKNAEGEDHARSP